MNYGYYIFGRVTTRPARPNKKKKKKTNSYPPHPHFSLLSQFVFLRLSLAQTVLHRLTPPHRTASPSLSLSNSNGSHTADLSLIASDDLTPLPHASLSLDPTISKSDCGGQDLAMSPSFQFHEIKILCFLVDFFFPGVLL